VESSEPKPAEGDINLRGQLSGLTNDQLLGHLDELLLELERRLLDYAKSGHEIHAMADEGLVLAARAGARLRQAQSSAAHTAGHLQVVGIGHWRPTSIDPSWKDDPRLTRPPGDRGEPEDD
jgi:hypothetical protein